MKKTASIKTLPNPPLPVVITRRGWGSIIMRLLDDAKPVVLIVFLFFLVNAAINSWHLFSAFRQNLGPHETISWLVYPKGVAAYRIYTRTQLEWLVGLQSAAALVAGAILVWPIVGRPKKTRVR